MADYLKQINHSFLDELIKNEIIPLIGAGFSRNAVMSKGSLPIPLWNELGKKFADLMGEEELGNDPISCISEYEKRNNRRMMIQKLYDFLNLEQAMPGRVHKVFVNIPFKILITTNFDNLIEKSYTAEKNVFTIYDSKGFLLRRKGIKLIKLHGDFDNLDYIVITKEDYEHATQTSLLRNNMKHLIVENSILLLGYSYRDPDFQKVIDELNSDLNPLSVTLFVLLINPDEVTRKSFENQPVIPIIIEDAQKQKEDVLFELFSQLNQHIESEIRSKVTNNSNVKSFEHNPTIYLKEHSVFVGREEEIESVSQSIKQNKIVSIVGPGGIGKTTIAIKALQRIRDDFSIIPIILEEPIYHNILKEISLQLQILESDPHAIRNKLDEAESALIFLDNFEVISNNQEKEIIPDINNIYLFLESLPSNVKVLLTSRNRKNIVGEARHSLEGLDTETGLVLFEKITNKLTINDSNEFRDALKAIVTKVNGLPLAIKLIAGSYYGGGIDEIKQIFNKIYEISKPGEEVRHFSIRNCYDYSYQTLSDTQKKLMSEIVKIKSPFNKNLFEYVFSRYEYPELFRLFNRSILMHKQFGTRDEDIFFEIHPLIRGYLEEQSENSNIQRDKTIVKLCNYYYDYLNKIYDTRKVPTEFARNSNILNYLLSHQPNDFEHILDYPVSIEFKSDYANMLVLVLLEFHYLSRAWSTNERGLQFDLRLNDSFRLGNDYRNFATIYAQNRDYKNAIIYGNIAIDYYLGTDEFDTLFDFCLEMAFLYSKDNNKVEADKLLVKIEEIINKRNPPFRDYKQFIKYSQGKSYYLYRTGNPNEAVEILKTTIEKCEKTNVPKRDIASLHQNIGVTLMEKGPYQLSYDSLNEAYRIYEGYDDTAKMFHMAGLIVKLLSNWKNSVELSKWVKKSSELSQIMKDKGIQYSAQEML